MTIPLSPGPTIAPRSMAIDCILNALGRSEAGTRLGCERLARRQVEGRRHRLDRGQHIEVPELHVPVQGEQPQRQRYQRQRGSG